MIGIYGIKNTETNMWYIGSSENIEKRFDIHRTKILQEKNYLGSDGVLDNFIVF